MKKIVSLAVVLCLCSVITQAEELRTWTSGKFKTEAEFVRVSDDGKTVTLKKTTGKEVHVALNKLSKEDQEFVAAKRKATPPIKKINLSTEVFRIWTTDTLKIEAKFAGVSDDGKTVTLKKNDGVIDGKDNGEEIAVALDKLSPEDQEFVAIKQQAPEALDSPEAIARRKVTLLKKTDLLNKELSGEPIVKLSDEEKDGVVQCVMLAEKAFGKELSDTKLSLMLVRMTLYKFSGRDEPYGGVIWLSSDGSKGSYGRSPTTKIDAYIACWALFDVHIVDKEEVWSVIAPLFPECNKLAGGIHNDKERERKDWQILEDRKKKLIQEIKDMRY